MSFQIQLSRDGYTLSQLAGDVTQCTTEALRTRAWRARRDGHPHPLPTPTLLPGGGVIYLRQDVEQWLLALRCPEKAVRRRGRPRKNESALRAAAAEGVSK
jgi:hypothetical protein